MWLMWRSFDNFKIVLVGSFFLLHTNCHDHLNVHTHESQVMIWHLLQKFKYYIRMNIFRGFISLSIFHVYVCFREASENKNLQKPEMHINVCFMMVIVASASTWSVNHKKWHLKRSENDANTNITSLFYSIFNCNSHTRMHFFLLVVILRMHCGALLGNEFIWISLNHFCHAKFFSRTSAQKFVSFCHGNKS